MALFSTIAQIKEHIAISVASEFSSVKPYIERAEEKYIKPALGETLYNDLHDYANDASSSTSSALTNDQFDDLLDKARRPLAYFGYYMFVPHLNVHMTDAGILVAVPENRAIASEWRVRDIQRSYFEGGYQTLETLLEFLEKNRTTYTQWRDSTAATVYKDHFIQTAKQFDEHYNINESRATFIAMKPNMKWVEENKVQSLLGSDFYDEVKGEIASSSISSENQALLDDYIRPAVAYLTIAESVQTLPVTFDHQGIFQVQFTGDHSGPTTAPADKQHISAVGTTAAERGQQYLEALERELNTNASASKYATFFNSDEYNGDETDHSDNMLKNSSDNKHFIV